MAFNRESAVQRAKQDLAERLGCSVDNIRESSVTDREFPDMSLGSPAEGEMSAQMISSGWQIDLEANNSPYQYRADKYQLRLHNFNGRNIVIE